MTTQLQPSGPADEYGVVYYNPVPLKVQSVGKWGGWSFEGEDGFWKQARFGYRGPMNLEQPDALQVGQTYLLTLGTKNNPGKQPYRDIYAAEELTPENTPDNYDFRYTPQGDADATPQGQPAATADDWNSDGHYDPPIKKRDSREASIEKQVAVKELGQVLSVLLTTTNTGGSTQTFTPEQVDYIRDTWFNYVYELWNGEKPPAQDTPEVLS